MSTQITNQAATGKAIQMVIMDAFQKGMPTNKVVEYMQTISFERQVSEYKKMLQSL